MSIKLEVKHVGQSWRKRISYRDQTVEIEAAVDEGPSLTGEFNPKREAIPLSTHLSRPGDESKPLHVVAIEITTTADLLTVRDKFYITIAVTEIDI